jgi:hypothetical protein
MGDCFLTGCYAIIENASTALNEHSLRRAANAHFVQRETLSFLAMTKKPTFERSAFSVIRTTYVTSLVKNSGTKNPPIPKTHFNTQQAMRIATPNPIMK